MADLDGLKQRAWEVAIHTFGTAWIFEQRIPPTRLKIRLVKFVGLVGPFLVGTLALSFGRGTYLELVFTVVGILGAIQAVILIWSLTANWEESYAYSKESARHNGRLAQQARAVALDSPDEAEMKTRVALLEQEHTFRSELDNADGISQPERVAGLRVALHQFQRKCITCGQVPDPQNPGSCGTCGQGAK